MSILPPLTAIKCAHAEVWPLERLVQNPRNPNRHPEAQIKILARVILAQGWRAPIVVSRRSGFIVKGHGRFAAARLAGLTEAPVDLQEYASEAEEWADMIADNRLAELAEISLPDLKDLLADMDTGAINMELTGFSEEALGDLFSQFHVAEASAPGLASGDRIPFREMSFVLHDRQAEDVEAALAKAKAEGGSESTVNENGNGNALHWLCAKYLRG